MYWSDASTLVPNAVSRVAVMRLPVPRTRPRIRPAIASS